MDYKRVKNMQQLKSGFWKIFFLDFGKPSSLNRVNENSFEMTVADTFSSKF